MYDYRFFYVPMSAREKHIEDDINNAIKQLEEAYPTKIGWCVDSFAAPDGNKFMLSYHLLSDEDEREPGDSFDSCKVKVVKGSQDMKMTEKLLNEALSELDDGNNKFYHLYHPSEFIYIILYSEDDGNYIPRVKIIPNPVSPNQGNISTTNIFATLLPEQLDENWSQENIFIECIKPLDKNNMIVYIELD
jgi:hypothetical protein